MIEWRLDGKTSEYLQPTSLLCVFFQFYWILWLEELGLGVWQGDPLPPLLFLVHGSWPWMACSSCIPLAGLLGEATRCCQRLHLLDFAFTRSIIPGVIFILKVRAWDNSPPPLFISSPCACDFIHSCLACQVLCDFASFTPPGHSATSGSCRIPINRDLAWESSSLQVNYYLHLTSFLVLPWA